MTRSTWGVAFAVDQGRPLGTSQMRGRTGHLRRIDIRALGGRDAAAERAPTSDVT